MNLEEHLLYYLSIFYIENRATKTQLVHFLSQGEFKVEQYNNFKINMIQKLVASKVVASKVWHIMSTYPNAHAKIKTLIFYIQSPGNRFQLGIIKMIFEAPQPELLRFKFLSLSSKILCWIPRFFEFLDSVNETEIWIAQIVELQNSLKMIPKIHFLIHLRRRLCGWVPANP